MKSKKILSSVIAVALAGGVLFGGTFAWQSISQTALNELSEYMNPGGRLHDDFNDVTQDGDLTRSYNKDVYVENFTDLVNNGVQVYARVRLDEYMEMGKGAGILNDDGTASSQNQAVSLYPGSRLEDKSTWKPYELPEDGDPNSDPNDPFRKYWKWDLEGQTTYMPTFNKNKDSLEADINGTSDAGFEDYVDYTKVTEDTNIAIYDIDAEESGVEVDELADIYNVDIQAVINANNEADAKGYLNEINSSILEKHVEVKEEPHTAKPTLDAFVIPMSQYIEWLNNDNPADDKGNFWVYDTDGWAYWANPIDPATATGLLLDGIQRTEEIINLDWYYAINVVAQFVTADDLGAPVYDPDTGTYSTGTGFYDATEGAPPSPDALKLLSAIGVQVTHNVETVDKLEEALAIGGIINLTADVEIEEPLEVTKNTVLNLNGNTIKPADGATIFNEGTGDWSLISVKGENTTLEINGNDEEASAVVATEDDSYCVDVRDGAKVVINGGTYVGNISAVYVEKGTAVVNDGTFSIQQLAGAGVEYKYVLNCLDDNYANGTAEIIVTGGTFVGFDPSAEIEAVPGNYLPDYGYAVKKDVDLSTGNQIWIVYKTAVQNTTADASTAVEENTSTTEENTTEG